jgi:hypothetical protein
MEIPVSQLPSGGFGYNFPSVRIKPLVFVDIVSYIDNAPKDDPMGKYLYDIDWLIKDDENIKNCYIMDVDFLIFYKKLCTVSDNLTYQVEVKCPHCGKTIQKTISFEKDIVFKQADPQIMNGAKIELGGHTYDTIVPTVNEFMKVFNVYLRYRKVTDLRMIKTIALMKDFDMRANQVEKDVLEAKHDDITLLMALRDLYYDRLEPIKVLCDCKDDAGRRRSMTVSVESLIVDFFRDLYVNSPIDATKIVFKQVS